MCSSRCRLHEGGVSCKHRGGARCAVLIAPQRDQRRESKAERSERRPSKNPRTSAQGTLDCRAALREAPGLSLFWGIIMCF